MGLFGPSKQEKDQANQIGYLQHQVGLLQHQIQQMGGGQLIEVNRMIDVANAHLAGLNAQVAQQEARLYEAGSRAAAEEQRVHALMAEAADVVSASSIADDGFYLYEHPAEASMKLGHELADVRARAKAMVASKAATTATPNFTFNGSAAQGKKFVADMSKLMLRSYNAEAENCVLTVRAGNLQPALARLERAKTQTERLGGMISLRVHPAYHQLRARELQLASLHLEAIRQEKEAEREHRAQLREEREAQREFEAQRAKLAKERSHYDTALQRLLEQGRTDEAQELRDELERIDAAMVDLANREANIRAGYVYVISNIGAFGERMVKIGMTRRLEPMDRVRELGDASVPFVFDVHALFFSDDAVGVEAELHRTFADRRVNRINPRREFFFASPTEVRDRLVQIAGNLLEFNEVPDAEQYRLSVAAREGDGSAEAPRRSVMVAAP